MSVALGLRVHDVGRSRFVRLQRRPQEVLSGREAVPEEFVGSRQDGCVAAKVLFRVLKVLKAPPYDGLHLLDVTVSGNDVLFFQAHDVAPAR